MKRFGAAILQYLFKNLVLFLGQENILHGHTALASIQVDTSIIALFLCCTDKDAVLLYDYHFILFVTFYLALYTQARCKRDRRKQSVIKFNDLYLYTVSCVPNCVYFHSNSSQEIQALLHPF